MRITNLSLLFLLGCADKADEATADDTTSVDTPGTSDSKDEDGDGFTTEDGDCDDTDASIHPDAEEVWYDGVDADCNGRSDYDADTDGHLSSDHGGDDCDDADSSILPGAEEVCDGIDNDCDGTIDDDALDLQTFYADQDADGYGDPDDTVQACAPPLGYTSDSTDCDDSQGAVYPGAEVVECDGLHNDCSAAEEAGRVELDGVLVGSIGEALSMAASGAAITLCEGRYAEHDLIASVPLAVSGLGPAAYTVLDAEGAPLLRVAEAIQLSNLTLTGGTGTVYGGVAVGGGVMGEDGAALTLSAVVVTDNTAGDGAGIFIGVGGQLTAQGSSVHSNYGDDSETPVPAGGGIYADDDATLSLQESTVWANTAGSGGGIALSTGSSLDGGGTTTIYSNEADLNGGGIDAVALDDEPIGVSGVTLLDNEAAAGGGIYCRGLALSSASLVANTSTISGGGIYAIGDISVDDTAFSANAADFNGGAVYAVGASVALTDSSLHNNSADFASYGGGVYLDRGTVSSMGTDWGQDQTDNAPYDLELGEAEQLLQIDGVTDFTCTDTAGTTCSP